MYYGQESLERAIAGALKAAIRDHGPITADKIGSAAKRIAGNLKNARLDGRDVAAGCGRSPRSGARGEGAAQCRTANLLHWSANGSRSWALQPGPGRRFSRRRLPPWASAI